MDTQESLNLDLSMLIGSPEWPATLSIAEGEKRIRKLRGSAEIRNLVKWLDSQAVVSSILRVGPVFPILRAAAETAHQHGVEMHGRVQTVAELLGL